MTEWIALTLAFAYGMGLAAVFLAVLWISLRGIARRSRPELWLLGGSAVRLALVLAGFYFIAAGGRWERVLAALAGFVLVRALAVGRVRRRLLGAGERPEASR